MELIEPTSENGKNSWRAKVEPANDFITNFEFNFLVIASGKNVPIEGFNRQSLDTRLAIAITANFVNKGTKEDTETDEIAGLSYQYHQVSFSKGFPKNKLIFQELQY